MGEQGGARAMSRARRNRPEGTRDSGSETVYSIRTRRTNGPDTDTLTPADIQRTSTRGQSRAEKRNKSTHARGTPPCRSTLPVHGANVPTACAHMPEAGLVSGKHMASAGVGVHALQRSSARRERAPGGSDANGIGPGVRSTARSAAHRYRLVHGDQHRHLVRAIDGSSSVQIVSLGQECRLLRA